MNCPNCGAAMELFDRRRYYFCRFCGTFHFIETPAVEGVRLLERPAAARPCPLCKAPLARSLLDDTYVVEHCERCQGLLMTRAVFAEAISRRRARESGPPAPPVPLDRRELDREVRCSSCHAPMAVHP
jgi:Zn-finger nucleic acid-binding protein